MQRPSHGLVQVMCLVGPQCAWSMAGSACCSAGAEVTGKAQLNNPRLLTRGVFLGPRPPAQFPIEISQHDVLPDAISREFLMQKIQENLQDGEAAEEGIVTPPRFPPRLGQQLPILIHGEPQSVPLQPRGRGPHCKEVGCTRKVPFYKLEEFPPGRPSLSNLGALCSAQRKKPSYGPWNLPQTSFSHLVRQGEALNQLELQFTRCCQLDEDQKLPCASNEVSLPCASGCIWAFVSLQQCPAGSPFNQAHPKLSWTLLARSSCLAFCPPPRVFPPFNADPSWSFAWGGEPPLPSPGANPFSSFLSPPPLFQWEKCLARYCKQEFSTKTLPFHCCRAGDREARLSCFSRQAPFPKYEGEGESLDLANLTTSVLDSICITLSHILGSLPSKGWMAPQSSLLLLLLLPQKSQFITAFCSSQRRSWRDPQRCCVQTEEATRNDCFDRSYLGHVSLLRRQQEEEEAEEAVEEIVLPTGGLLNPPGA
uniref:Uncharacterized protein n=1 Tax=Naja naja TaxID=35670 RepID=A0A8C6XXH3_NAJNA